MVKKPIRYKIGVGGMAIKPLSKKQKEAAEKHQARKKAAPKKKAKKKKAKKKKPDTPKAMPRALILKNIIKSIDNMYK